jgi:hypothetical protein
LQAGTYTLTDVDNDTDGPNGLPSIRSPLTLTGEGADTTFLERAASAPPFRLVHVAASGHLRLTKITIRGGGSSFRGFLNGAGLYNDGGTMHLIHTTVAGNLTLDNGGGLYNNRGTVHLVQTTFTQNQGGIGEETGGGLFTNGGTVHITHSRFTNNLIGNGGGLHARGGVVLITQSTVAGNGADAGGGIGIGPVGGAIGGPGGPAVVTLVDSTVEGNHASSRGGGISNEEGLLLITNSTVARNRVGRGGPTPLGGGLANFGTTVMLNTTFAENDDESFGLLVFGGIVTLQNTLLASNCGARGVVVSLGHNLIGDPTSCTITLQPSDLTGDPGLDAFTDNGKPGTGHFPLLPTSQAIDAGNDAVCPLRDQLGQRRVNIPKVGASRCDIGAIEFPGKHDRQHDEEDDHHDKDLAAAD